MAALDGQPHVAEPGRSRSADADRARRRSRSLAPASKRPLGNILDEECRAQVHSGLDRLSTLDRETLVAFYFDGRSLVEMSDQFRTPVGTIKRRLHVARKRLARELATTMV